MYRWASTRSNDTHDGDSWDGKQLRNVTLKDRETVLFFSWCNDGAVFKHFIKESSSPWVMECLNISPKHRYTFGALFFVAMLPKSITSYNSLYGDVLRRMEQSGAFDGFTAEDEEGTITTLKIKLVRKVRLKHLLYVLLYKTYTIHTFRVLIRIPTYTYTDRGC